MSSQSNITPGPIAPENNPPINPQYYKPRKYNITAITTGLTTTITTDFPVDYVIGQLCRVLIPQAYGSIQLNEKQGYVIAIPASNQVELNINSQVCNAFISSPVYGPTKPQILAIGDVNTGQINTGRTNNKTYIPGSFINISPQ
jgi:hypothetical protein